MTIGILECGVLPETLAARHGPYADMIRRLVGPGRKAPVFRVTEGEWPASATECQGYVIGGSPAGVYDDLPWIPPLLDFLRAARGRAGLVGICFGHQAMAAAFGGQVVKSPKGWAVGLHRYAVLHRAPWMDRAEALDAPASHQDQVVGLPPGARVTLASGFTPYAGLDYGDAISFQFHPEFDAAFAVGLIAHTRDRYPALADAAIDSYRGSNHWAGADWARVGGWVGRFLDAPGQALPQDASAQA